MYLQSRIKHQFLNTINKILLEKNNYKKIKQLSKKNKASIFFKKTKISGRILILKQCILIKILFNEITNIQKIYSKKTNNIYSTTNDVKKNRLLINALMIYKKKCKLTIKPKCYILSIHDVLNLNNLKTEYTKFNQISNLNITFKSLSYYDSDKICFLHLLGF